MFNSVVWSTFILLFNHHDHHQSPEFFHLPQPKLSTHETLTPLPHLLLQPLAIIILPVRVTLATLGISYKWNHNSTCPFLCLASVSIIMSSRFIHVASCIRICSLYKAELYSIVWIYYVLFIHSYIDEYLGPCK